MSVSLCFSYAYNNKNEEPCFSYVPEPACLRELLLRFMVSCSKKKKRSITQAGAPQPVKNALSCRSRKKGANACYKCGYEQCFQTNQFGNNKSNTHFFLWEQTKTNMKWLATSCLYGLCLNTAT